MIHSNKHLPTLFFFVIFGASILFTSCGDDEPNTSDPCAMCINGTCIDNVCECDPFWTGVNCDSIQPPTKMIITGLYVSQIEHQGPNGPWDTAVGEEAPDLVYYVYDDFYFNRDEFQGLSHLYRSDVFENYEEDAFNQTDLRIELGFGVEQTITILLAENDAQGTAYVSDFMELAYLDLPLEWDTIPPYTTEEIAFGTLQNPFNIKLTFEYE